MIGSIIKTLFGGKGAAKDGMTFAQNAVTGVGKWVDGQKFTDQEKSEMNLKAGSMMLDMIKYTQSENSVRSVTRRYLAWGIMGSYLLLLLAAALMYGSSKEYSSFLMGIANDSSLGSLVVAVGGFYFLSGIVRSMKG